MIKKRARILFSILACLGFWVLQGQSSLEVTNCIYLKDVFLVAKPGAAAQKTNIVIRNGIIEAVGPTVQKPFDAKPIAVDSHFVYAGFIDGFSHIGIKKEEETKSTTRIVPSQATDEQSGIVPQKSATTVFSTKESSISDFRNIGFGIVHVAPQGNMLPGKSAVMSLGSSGNAMNLLLKNDYAQYARLATSRAVYPSTVIGVMSKFRDLYKNADLLQKNNATFEQGVAAIARPKTSEALTALLPVVNKKQTIYWEAEQIKDIHKVLMLKKELGFNLVLSNVKHLTGMQDEIKKTGTGLLLSLKLPEAMKEDSAKAKKEKDVKKTESEMAFEARKKDAYKELVSQAGLLEKSNIPFAFSLKDAKAADVKSNILILVENGLSTTAALAALTTTPAGMLGLTSKAGTVEPGKMANLVITDTSYFDKKSKIKFVIIEGTAFEQESKAKGKPSEESKAIKAGKYSYTMEIPQNEQKGKIEIAYDGGTYKVEVSNDSTPGGTTPASNIEAKDKDLSFKINPEMNGMSFDIKIDIKFDGPKYTGNVSIAGFGTFPISGELIP